MSTLYVARCCDSAVVESRVVRPRLHLPTVDDTSATRPSSQRRQLAPEVSRRPTVSVSTSARSVPVGAGSLRQPSDRRPRCERRLRTRLPSRYSTGMENDHILGKRNKNKLKIGVTLEISNNNNNNFLNAVSSKFSCGFYETRLNMFMFVIANNSIEIGCYIYDNGNGVPSACTRLSQCRSGRVSYCTGPRCDSEVCGVRSATAMCIFSCKIQV